MSNLKQIGYAVSMYGNDYNGWMPLLCKNNNRAAEFSKQIKPCLKEYRDETYFASRNLNTILCCPNQEIPSGVTRLYSGYTIAFQWLEEVKKYGCWE